MAFTDDFSGESGTVSLESHVPSGGTAWTRVGGTSTHAQVGTSAELRNNTTDSTGTLWLVDDQGSANHYSQYVCRNTNYSGFVCNRATNASNYVGVRVSGAKLQIFQRSGGTLTQIGSTGATTVSLGDTIRLESNGTTHKAFLNGSEEVSGTSSVNSTTTTQGFNARSSGGVAVLDDYEAGALSTSITGALAATESGSDTASLAGDVLIDGTLAATESGADTASLSGDVFVSGALAAQEAGADVAAFTGEASDAVFGTLDATETGSDVAAMAGDVLIDGTLVAQEAGSDTAALAGDVLVDGALAATEGGADTAAFTGTAAGPITGTMDAVESGADTASFSGPVADTEAPATGGGYAIPSPRYQTREERDAERRRLGILPAAPVAVVEAVKAIAATEAAKPVAPSPAKLESQLRADLAQAKETYRDEYLKALVAQIELQQLQEIDRQLQEEEDEAIAMLMMALAA